jgi:ankyrin repeat protein
MASRVASLADALGATRAPSVDRPHGSRASTSAPSRAVRAGPSPRRRRSTPTRASSSGDASARRASSPRSPALAPSSRARAVARAGRGGGTPGSWNLGVAHSAASAADQRAYVDRLFAAYATLVDAASEGDRRALERVMDAAYGPAPDASTTKIRDAQVRAALERACENGHVEAFEFLLDRGATFLDDAAATRGGDAASRGHAGVLDVLFRRGMIHPEARDDRGRTALMAAAERGDATCAQRCVDAGCDVDAAASDGVTAAMLAAGAGHAGCLNVLRAAGADLERRRESDGMTAMEMHRARVREEVARATFHER